MHNLLEHPNFITLLPPFKDINTPFLDITLTHHLNSVQKILSFKS